MFRMNWVFEIYIDSSGVTVSLVHYQLLSRGRESFNGIDILPQLEWHGIVAVFTQFSIVNIVILSIAFRLWEVASRIWWSGAIRGSICAIASSRYTASTTSRTASRVFSTTACDHESSCKTWSVHVSDVVVRKFLSGYEII